MFEVMVKAVLDRMPDYEIDLDGVAAIHGQPHDDGVSKLPVTFTPGQSLGTPRRSELARTGRTARRRGCGR